MQIIERVKPLSPTKPTNIDWSAVAARVLAGEPIDRATALAALQSPDAELLPLLAAAYEVRRAAFGNTVQLYYLMNVKSGLCPEDCHYCSQSKVSKAEIEKYPMVSREEILAGAQRAVDSKACTFCIVASGRGPTERDLEHVADAVREIKDTMNIRVCACLGILKDGQAERLRDAGADRYNHNLNTSEDFHGSICTTHTHSDRVRTVEEIKEAGISPCSGGIIGMGESDEDVVSMAFALRDLEIESIPLNFYIPIPGVPFANKWNLNPRYCLKALAMFRFVNPTREIRIAGGRELHLGTLQPMGLYAANSIFVSDYLTTKGQSAEDDYKMIEDLGFTIVAPPAR
ncbi:MAG: biotin synthase BioB [Capsulimonas sp.]|uniref:biotin synthase BioB n=1 Tax=Capsulimonas sp. TaxID=2494211 RepID=UPI003263DF4C